jgi:hypothetical protein
MFKEVRCEVTCEGIRGRLDLEKPTDVWGRSIGLKGPGYTLMPSAAARAAANLISVAFKPSATGM